MPLLHLLPQTLLLPQPHLPLMLLLLPSSNRFRQ
jgi:hypothetical protein